MLGIKEIEETQTPFFTYRLCREFNAGRKGDSL